MSRKYKFHKKEGAYFNTAGMTFSSIDCFKERFKKITAFLGQVLIIYNNNDRVYIKNRSI